jgi:hypothetical protein
MISRLPFKRALAVLASTVVLAACSSVPQSPSSSEALGGKPNFNGVWEMLDMAKVVRPEQGQPPYTPEAAKLAAEFKSWDPKKDDPSLYCDLKGMPWMMLSRARTYPAEIYQTAERVDVFFELFDTSRSIRVNGKPAPKNISPSINGYSTATWDNDTLVIKTTALAERLYPSPQLRSEKAELTERWKMVKDPKEGDLIEIDFEIVDPVVYTRPVKGKQVFKRAAPDVVVASYNCPEKLWLKHVDDRRAQGKAAAK